MRWSCLEWALLQEKQQSFSPADFAFYLHIWALAQVERFPLAATLLLPTIPYTEEVEVLELARTLLGSDLRQKAPVWLCLGSLAARHGNLSEAQAHYRKCISTLNERRMNLPLMRSRALCECGRTCIGQTAFVDAIAFYEAALACCGDDQAHPVRLPTTMGLCEASLRQAFYASALEWGMQALPLARERRDALAQVSLLSWLGKSTPGGKRGTWGARACAIKRRRRWRRRWHGSTSNLRASPN